MSEPTKDEAARFGLTVEEASSPPAEVYPDNLATVNVFIAMQTQWRVGMAGATGLDYAALPAVMRCVGVARKDWSHVFDGLRAMEDETLAEWARRREKEKGKRK